MNIVVVIASTYQQARIVLEKEGLPRPGRTVDGVHVTTITSAADIPRLHGTLPSRVIVAFPALNDAWKWRSEATAVAAMRLRRAHTQGVADSPYFDRVFT